MLSLKRVKSSLIVDLFERHCSTCNVTLLYLMTIIIYLFQFVKAALENKTLKMLVNITYQYEIR